MNSHSRPNSQSGATLLIIIGIGAALAVMTASLVMVIGNMQANTADSRTREKAATVGEAAMDAQMYALALNWPKVSVPNPVPTLDATLVRTQFPANEFPNSTGDLVGAVYYDNSDTTGDGHVDIRDAKWDANGDSRMYVEAQGKVGRRSTRFQALVERTFVNTTFPHGIAVYDSGAMDSNGGGNNPKVTVHYDGGYPVSGYVGGAIGAADVFQSTISVTSPTIPPLKDLLDEALIGQIISMAQGMGRYYDTTRGAQRPADMSGVCVIRVADGTTVQPSGGINMAQGPNAVPQPADQPGILLILGPDPDPSDDVYYDMDNNTGPHIKIDMANNDRFYGVFYTDGQLDFAHGTPAFFGMVIFKSYMDMRGTADIKYDDSAISKLADRWTLTVRLVPNTWREIHPN